MFAGPQRIQLALPVGLDAVTTAVAKLLQFFNVLLVVAEVSGGVTVAG